MVFRVVMFTTEIVIAHIYEKHWSMLVDNGFVGQSIGLDKDDISNAGILYAWF